MMMCVCSIRVAIETELWIPATLALNSGVNKQPNLLQHYFQVNCRCYGKYMQVL